ncbi:hypothetical protein AVL55_10520 [Alteromonas macleodii]|uniref:Uncharacterized protein n=1 Tax=Alteromonas macleodii TaxID=28108 RepID=A0A126PZT4_ALTMA|nr:hypothetical protein [Alteromonas macleodii]AMJ98566.1 hypothetical protein AVL55_10520 [Alteromonas macleodii]
MFKFWWTKNKDKVITKVRIDFTLDSEQVEHIVAKSYTPITSKVKLREAIDRYLRDHGWQFDSEDISYEVEEVEAAYKKVRPVVKRLMPQLYAKPIN